MRKEVLFSVIIPTYNRALLLKNAITSVIQQTCIDWELIIVDDGSTDDTRNVVNAFQDNRIKYVYQKNLKLSAARNTGVKSSYGRYICLLDDDDVYLEDHLEHYQNWLVDHGYPSTILRLGYQYKTKQGLFKGPMYIQNMHNNPVNFAAYYFCASVSLCIPRICFTLDQFISGTEPWEDTHFMLRIFARYDFVQLPHYTYIYIKHQGMGSNKIYTEMDTMQLALQNTNAMKHLFKNYGELVQPFLPKKTLRYLTSEKFSQHAFNVITYGKFKLGWKLFIYALKEDKGNYQWKKYIKILILFPLKFFTGYPKRDHLI